MLNALWKLAIRITGSVFAEVSRQWGRHHGLIKPGDYVTQLLATQSPGVRVDTAFVLLIRNNIRPQQPAWEIKANISRLILDYRGSWFLISAHGLLFCLWKLTQDAITHHNTVKRRIWQLQDVFVKIFMISTIIFLNLHFAISDKTDSI